jgi:phosphocarrier protein
MITKKFIVREEHGLHGRPAVKIVEKCQKFNSKIKICYGCNEADGCSILQILLLAARKGEQIEVIADGSDEENAITELSEIFEDGSGI